MCECERETAEMGEMQCTFVSIITCLKTNDRLHACPCMHARTQNMLSNEVDAAAITNIIEAHRTTDKQMHTHAHTLLRQHSVNEDRSQSCRCLVLQVQGHQSLSEH